MADRLANILMRDIVDTLEGRAYRTMRREPVSIKDAEIMGSNILVTMQDDKRYRVAIYEMEG